MAETQLLFSLRSQTLYFVLKPAVENLFVFWRYLLNHLLKIAVQRLSVNYQWVFFVKYFVIHWKHIFKKHVVYLLDVINYFFFFFLKPHVTTVSVSLLRSSSAPSGRNTSNNWIKSDTVWSFMFERLCNEVYI